MNSATLTLTRTLFFLRPQCSRHSTETQASEHTHGTGREKSLFVYEHPSRLDAGEWVARLRPAPRASAAPEVQQYRRGQEPREESEEVTDEPIVIRFPVAAVHPVSIAVVVVVVAATGW
jgi:hypothetical protein